MLRLKLQTLAVEQADLSVLEGHGYGDGGCDGQGADGVASLLSARHKTVVVASLKQV